MPELVGRFVPVLRVSDAEASAEWYIRVLSLVQSSHYIDPAGPIAQVALEEPRSGLTLCLVAGGGGDQPFHDDLVGLDHLEFLVPSVEELSRGIEHLDAQLVPHSGIKAPHYSTAAMVTFRDPDNIQLELFCPQR